MISVGRDLEACGRLPSKRFLRAPLVENRKCSLNLQEYLPIQGETGGILSSLCP